MKFEYEQGNFYCAFDGTDLIWGTKVGTTYDVHQAPPAECDNALAVSLYNVWEVSQW